MTVSTGSPNTEASSSTDSPFSALYRFKISQTNVLHLNLKCHLRPLWVLWVLCFPPLTALWHGFHVDENNITVFFQVIGQGLLDGQQVIHRTFHSDCHHIIRSSSPLSPVPNLDTVNGSGQPWIRRIFPRSASSSPTPPPSPRKARNRS